MDLVAFYVMVSRVTTSNGLRLLQRDEDALAKVLRLQWTPALCAWDDGYDANGMWDPALAIEALEKATTARNSTELKSAATRRNKKNVTSKRTPPAILGSATKDATVELTEQAITRLVRHRRNAPENFQTKIHGGYSSGLVVQERTELEHEANLLQVLYLPSCVSYTPPVASF